MSMFDRNVKIQFNKMKYHNNVFKHAVIENGVANMKDVKRGRYFMVILGLSAGYSFFNYDVTRYKFTRGLVRWKNRVVKLLSSPNSHHDHSHDHSHDKSHSKDSSHDKHDKHDNHEKDHHNKEHH